MKHDSILRLVLLCLFASPVAAQPSGIWEGVIQDPTRPLVVNVDLDKYILKLDATGTTEWKIEQLVIAEAAIRFNVTIGGRPFQFSGQIERSKITGEMKTPDRIITLWLEPLPIFPIPRNRTEAWQQDLDTVGRFLRYDRSYSDATRQIVRDRVAKLMSSVSNRTDQEIMVEFSRAVALGGNAHTRVYLVRNRTEVKRLPIRVWWFQGQLRIVRATNEHTDLLGCRVVKIGNLPVSEAANRVGDITAGNASWQTYMSTYFLTSPDILFGTSIEPNPDEANFTVRCFNGQKQVKLKALPFRKSMSAVEGWWDLAPDNREANAAFLPVLRPKQTPGYLRRTKENYWFEYLSVSKLLYFRYNRSQQQAGGQSVTEFGDRLLREMAEKMPAALVVDLRFNTGGDLTVGKPLIKKITDRRGDIPVYVITGRSTFSAGITHVVQLKEWANAIIVGEPVGDELDMWSEGGNLLMPNSQLTLHYANGFHSYSKRDRQENWPYVEDMSVEAVTPDIVVEPTWGDYINGRDAAMDSIGRLIKTGRHVRKGIAR